MEIDPGHRVLERIFREKHVWEVVRLFLGGCRGAEDSEPCYGCAHSFAKYPLEVEEEKDAYTDLCCAIDGEGRHGLGHNCRFLEAVCGLALCGDQDSEHAAEGF